MLTSNGCGLRAARRIAWIETVPAVVGFHKMLIFFPTRTGSLSALGIRKGFAPVGLGIDELHAVVWIIPAEVDGHGIDQICP
jgi:hypothetical protein